MSRMKRTREEEENGAPLSAHLRSSSSRKLREAAAETEISTRTSRATSAKQVSRNSSTFSAASEQSHARGIAATVQKDGGSAGGEFEGETAHQENVIPSREEVSVHASTGAVEAALRGGGGATPDASRGHGGKGATPDSNLKFSRVAAPDHGALKHSPRSATPVREGTSGIRQRKAPDSPRGRGASFAASSSRRQAPDDLDLEGFVGLQGFTDYIRGEISDHDSLLYSHLDHTSLPEPPAGRSELPKLIRVPIHLEITIAVGFLVCLDEFLYNFTLLPLRSLVSLLDSLYHFLSRALSTLSRSTPLQAGVDISYLYHWIRGEMSSYIKLYVIYNVLEVFDKLCCSLGQDILNSMATWGAPAGSAVQPWYWVFCSAVIATAYTSTHAYILLVQVVTLNVAINSQNNSLITLLVANNFTELKGHVFKKFDEGTLLQVLCADMVERFQMFIFLALVTFQNWWRDDRAVLSSGKVGPAASWMQEWLPIVFFTFASELCVDYIKHAFVTKFNKIEPEVYNRYRDVIWEHVCNAWRLREPHRVAKHIGFVSLPLSVVFLRVCYHTMRPSDLVLMSHNWSAIVPLAILWWLVFSAFKIQLYLLLLGMACEKHSKMVSNSKIVQASSEADLNRRGSGQARGKASPRVALADGKEAMDAAAYMYAGTVAAQEAAVVQKLMGVEMFTRMDKAAAGVGAVGGVEVNNSILSAHSPRDLPLQEAAASGHAVQACALGASNLYRTSSNDI